MSLGRKEKVVIRNYKITNGKSVILKVKSKYSKGMKSSTQKYDIKTGNHEKRRA